MALKTNQDALRTLNRYKEENGAAQLFWIIFGACVMGTLLEAPGIYKGLYCVASVVFLCLACICGMGSLGYYDELHGFLSRR